MLSEAARKDPAMTGQYDYERIENEFYPTPPKFVHCLAEYVDMRWHHWWEPCVGQGHIAFEVEDITGHGVRCSDLVRYPNHPALGDMASHVELLDFLSVTQPPVADNGIVTNPPYLTAKMDDPEWQHLAPLARSYGMKSNKVSLAELFLRHAIKLMEPSVGIVAMFLRNEFDCGKGRLDLFQHPAFAGKIVCTERPRWIEGSTGSPRHNYAWFVFDWGRDQTTDAFALYSNPSKAQPIRAQ